MEKGNVERTVGSSFDDEVSRAWAKVQRAQVKSKEKNTEKKEKSEKIEEKTEEKNEHLEGLIPKEEDFVSKIPFKGPSLEMQARQNLENTIGPFFESDEKEEKVSYSSNKKQDKGYAKSKDEEERHYDNPMLLRAEFNAPPQFQESEFVRMAKGDVHAPERELWGKEYISAEEKELAHERLDREKKESVRKYKPQM